MSAFNESVVEDAALDYFARARLRDGVRSEPRAGRARAERALVRAGLPATTGCATPRRRINPDVDADLIDEAIKRLERAESQSAVAENARVHKLLIRGRAGRVPRR